MAEYQLFPDIKLIVGDIYHTSCDNTMEISYCIKGVCEYRLNDEYYYVMDKKYFICMHDDTQKYLMSCSADQRGITLLIDLRCNSEAVAEFIDIPDIFRNIQYCEQHIFDADEKIQKLFSEIYYKSDEYKISMLRIKLLELFMLLSEQKRAFTEQQKVIKQVGAFICQNISEHFTIAQLSEIFGINQTALKSGFKEVLGCPVYTYVKNRKMFCAAEIMCGTDMRIIDIAEEVGYCNASKFSSAFREVMGVNPKYYQTEHKNASSLTNRLIHEKLAY